MFTEDVLYYVRTMPINLGNVLVFVRDMKL